MQTFDTILRLYDYALPPGRIAQAPATPRDSAKLLIYERKTGQVRWSSVHDLITFLPPKCVLVLNETKVIPARLRLSRATGGHVEILILGNERGCVRALANRTLRQGEFLTLNNQAGFIVRKRTGKAWVLKPTFPLAKLPSILTRHGVMPLPPYIKHSSLTEAELRKRYQTVFAKTSGSIAAPTASLHFTKRLLTQLEKSGITIARVTLHVHLGTFAPLTDEQWKMGKLHQESYSIDSKTAKLLTQAKKSGRPIIACGTTVARTLESASNAKGTITRPRGTTQLFIKEGYRFTVVDGLLTNFHVPRSSLLMLVAQLTGREKLLELYTQAIANDFRFFSFGDAMLIL